MNKLTDTEKHLADMLSGIWDDNDFIVGVLNSLQDDAERNEVIEFIECNNDITSEQVDLLSLNISRERFVATAEGGAIDFRRD